MEILDAGHHYQLDSLDGDNKQNLQFVKQMGDNFPFNSSEYSGTNCQEVLRALIDRTEYLQKQKSCAETESIIGLLRAALLLFELRAAREHNQHLALYSTQVLMSDKPCKECGHIRCKLHKEPVESLWSDDLFSRIDAGDK